MVGFYRRTGARSAVRFWKRGGRSPERLLLPTELRRGRGGGRGRDRWQAEGVPRVHSVWCCVEESRIHSF